MILEKDYPYDSAKMVSYDCRTQGKDRMFLLDRMPGYVSRLFGTADYLEAAVRQMPVGVSFEVTDDFSFYRSGIYSGVSCSGKLNHAMLVVGFGQSGSHRYWIVRNSWGTSWGDNGYVKILRSETKKEGTCNLHTYMYYPAIDI